ncbi:MAG: hypothetical protein ACJAU6_002420 [Alphaproteobacteria bacterium]|jgi:hypothetical protein
MAFENRFPQDNCVKIPERPAKVAGQSPSKAKNRTNLLILVKTLLISGLMQRSQDDSFFKALKIRPKYTYAEVSITHKPILILRI